MIKRLLTLLLFAVNGTALTVFAAGLLLPSHSVRIKGEGYSFFISAPLGWVLDRDAAESQNSDAVFYPKGTRYDTAPSVLYVSVSPRPKGAKALDKLIQQDISEAKAKNPKLSVEKGPPLYTRLQKSTQTRFYNHLDQGASETLAYLDEGDYIVTFSLSSSDALILNEDLPALQELVSSYEFLSDEEQGPALGRLRKTPFPRDHFASKP